MDRLAPTHRPEGQNAGSQQWRDLLFLHWPVPVSAVRPLVPPGLELDLWEDQAWVGLVPFAMQRVAPRPWPASLGWDFLETNLRTYVHRGGRPGVWFFSLEAENLLAVHAARRMWGLPYHHARMGLQRQGPEISYRTVRRASPHPGLFVRYAVGEALGASKPDYLELFLLERYLLFAEKAGTLHIGQVHHPPYPAHRATVLEVEESLFAAVGLPPASGAPALAHYAPGVDVEVFGPWPAP